MVSMQRTKSNIATGTRKVGRDVKHAASDATDFIGCMMRDYPLAVGAALFGLGLAGGLAIPASRREDEWLGPVRDDLLHRARHAGEALLEQGEKVAEQTVDRACAAVEAKLEGRPSPE